MTFSNRSATGQDGEAVLIVEDDVQFAELLSAFLRLSGYLPERVCLLGHAFAAIEETGVKTVLLDLSLPDSRWENTLARIPALRDKGASRVLVMTGAVVCEPLRERAQAAGAECVLAKNEPHLLPGIVKALDKANG